MDKWNYCVNNDGMASVYLQTNPGACSPFYQARLRGPNGKQIWLTTKLKNETLALDIAKMWEQACLDAENRQLSQEKASKLIELVRTKSKCAKTALVTERLMNKLLKESIGAPLGGRDFSEFCESWLKRCQKDTARSTSSRYRTVIQLFLDSLPESRRRAPVDSITLPEVQRFCDLEIEAGKSASTVKLEKAILAGLFTSAREQDIAVKNPVEFAKVQREEQDERVPFDDQSVRKLVQVADIEWKGMILLGFQAGMRISDAAHLRWSNVDLESGLLSYIPSKTRRKKTRVVAPLHDDLILYLESLPSSDDPKDPIFPTLHDTRVTGRTGLSQQFLDIMARAKIVGPLGKEKFGKGRQFSLLTFHSLRHGNVSRMANSGTSAEVRMAIAGHLSKSVHDGYTHTDIASCRVAIAKLPSVLKGVA